MTKKPSSKKPSSRKAPVKDAPIDDLPKKKREPYIRNDSIIIDPSLMPKENKTIEQYLKEADQDFTVGGFKFLSRAKERYQQILQMFS